MHLEPRQDLGRRSVELDERGQALRHRRLGDEVLEVTVEKHAAANGLCQNEVVARNRADVAPDLVGMHEAGDRKAELGLLVIGGMATAQDGARRSNAVDGTGDHTVQNLRLELVGREPDQAETGNGSGAHRVHVAEGVGRCDLSKHERVVDRRGDEVGGHHHGDFFVDAVHGRVVAGVETDQQVRVGVRGKGLQQLVEPDRAQLRRSTTSLGQARQGGLAE